MPKDKYNITPEETQETVSKKALKKGKTKVAKTAKRLETLTVEYVDCADLKPNSYNPNRQDEHEFELLCRSMKEDGFTQPIIAMEDGTIIDGEHRWRAAKTLGMKAIPVVKTKMTKEQMRIATLRHNRARGNEDVELSVQVLRDLQELGALEWAQESLMLSDAEMNRLIEDIPISEAVASDEFSEAWMPKNEAEMDSIVRGSIKRPQRTGKAVEGSDQRIRPTGGFGG